MPSMKRSGARQRSRTTLRSRKHTAWKKSRQFGDSYSPGAWSRVQHIYIPWTRLPSRVSGDGPQLIENKPHRDYFFPVTGEEVLDRIGQVPHSHREGLTHVWLRHEGPNHGRKFFGSYCTGPGYRAIVLNPWPRSLKWDIGPKLYNRWKKMALQHKATLKRSRGRWTVTFSMEESRRFYLDNLILHELGHHVDSRRRSRANTKALEDFADQYALKWARRLNCETQSPSVCPGMTKEGWKRLKALIMGAYPNWSAQFGSELPPPHPSLSVCFCLVDRQNRNRSNLIWIAPRAIANLTVAGLIARVNQAKSVRPSKLSPGGVR